MIRHKETPITESYITSLFAEAAKSAEERFARLHEQIRKQRLYTTVRTTDLTNAVNGVLFRDGIHLEDNTPIASVVVENHGATATVSVYEGPYSTGRVVSLIKPGRMQICNVSDNIAAISLGSSAADTGLVIVTVSSQPLSPGIYAL